MDELIRLATQMNRATLDNLRQTLAIMRKEMQSIRHGLLDSVAYGFPQSKIDELPKDLPQFSVRYVSDAKKDGEEDGEETGVPAYWQVDTSHADGGQWLRFLDNNPLESEYATPETGLNQNQVDIRINTLSPEIDRLPSDGTTGQVGIRQSDGTVAWGDQVGGDIEEYDSNETYTLGRLVYTGTGDLKLFWFAADEDHFNDNAPSATASVATTGWSRASEFKSYRGNFSSSSTYYHQGDWGYLPESGENVYYVNRSSGSFTRAQIPTAQQWDQLTGTSGLAGNNGWTAEITIVSDGERRVQQVADWFGGTGTKPATGQYIGATGFEDDIADGIDVRGESADGDDGVSRWRAYQKAETEPTEPSASDFTASDGEITAYATGWSENVPDGDDTLWVVDLSIDDSTVTVHGVYQTSGVSGDGEGGTGEDGDSSGLAFTRAETEPDEPGASDFTVVDGEITDYPDGWSEDPPSSAAGTFTLTYTVTDSDGDSHSVEFDLVVSE